MNGDTIFVVYFNVILPLLNPVTETLLSTFPRRKRKKNVLVETKLGKEKLDRHLFLKLRFTNF